MVMEWRPLGINRKLKVILIRCILLLISELSHSTTTTHDGPYYGIRTTLRCCGGRTIVAFEIVLVEPNTIRNTDVNVYFLAFFR